MSKIERLVINEAVLRDSTTYVSLRIKEAMVNELAEQCIDRVELATKTTSGRNEPMPPFYRENEGRTSRCLMGVFVKYYFKGWEPKVEVAKLMLSEAEFDYYAGNHIFNQIERLEQSARDPEIKNRIADMLSDYRDFERRFKTAIQSAIRINNDSCNRILATITLLGTPEAVQEACKAAEKARAEFDEYIANRKAPGEE